MVEDKKTKLIEHIMTYAWVLMIIVVVCFVLWQLSIPPKYSNSECLEYCKLLCPNTTNAFHIHPDSCVCEEKYDMVCTPDNQVCIKGKMKELCTITINKSKQNENI